MVTITDIKATNLHQLPNHFASELCLDVFSLPLINTLKSGGFFEIKVSQ